MGVWGILDQPFIGADVREVGGVGRGDRRQVDPAIIEHIRTPVCQMHGNDMKVLGIEREVEALPDHTWRARDGLVKDGMAISEALRLDLFAHDGNSERCTRNGIKRNTGSRSTFPRDEPLVGKVA